MRGGGRQDSRGGGRERGRCRGLLLVVRGRLDGAWARLLLEDRIVAQALALRLFAIVARRMSLVALHQRNVTLEAEQVWVWGLETVRIYTECVCD